MGVCLIASIMLLKGASNIKPFNRESKKRQKVYLN